jgi:uncharacterized protein (DUF433 family)
MAVLIIEHIEQSPDVAHGAPRISGTRIRVQDVVAWHVRGDWSIAQIVKEFGLSPAQVHAALAYYYDHQAEIDRTLDQDGPVERGREAQDLKERLARRK